jgi:predicted GIY-YIG superfamily endonuclease
VAVYLIHFGRPPAGRGGHYVGYTTDVERRFQEHQTGKGGRATVAAHRAGITMELVRVWPDGDRAFEQRLRRLGRLVHYCPVCAARRVDSDGRLLASPGDLALVCVAGEPPWLLGAVTRVTVDRRRVLSVRLHGASSRPQRVERDWIVKTGPADRWDVDGALAAASRGGWTTLSEARQFLEKFRKT